MLGSAMLCPQLLHAQETPLLPEEKPQIETRHTAVLERVQPGYVAPGIPLGGFRLAPSVEVTGIHDDNIFGTQDDRVADSLLRIQPQLALQSQWARNSLSLDAKGKIDRYLNRSTENIADYSVTGRGVFDINQATTLTTAIRAEGIHQSRLSQDIFSQTIKPIYYTQQSGAVLLAHDFNKLRLSTTARVARFDFRDGQLRRRVDRGLPAERQYELPRRRPRLLCADAVDRVVHQRQLQYPPLPDRVDRDAQA
ncbi:outer membrane beta-barrel protein [Sphingomonas aurantiaca]|uniref:outer membrane beta-barrel protein n=1 Tax=Sphingomonas aurantiaca TaxID=185949 RepID=UPI002FE28CA9